MADGKIAVRVRNAITYRTERADDPRATVRLSRPASLGSPDPGASLSDANRTIVQSARRMLIRIVELLK